MILFLIIVYLIIPIFLLVGLYGNKKSLAEKIAYIKAQNYPNSSFYDKWTHRFWEKEVLKTNKNKILKNELFKVIILSGETVYVASNEKGEIYFPKEEDIIELELAAIPNPGAALFSTGLAYYTAFIILVSFFMPTIINYYKKTEKQNEIREKTETYNKNLTLINEKLDSINEKNKYLYIYTNDNSLSEAIIVPNYEFGINQYDFDRTQTLSGQFQLFLSKEDSLGYQVLLKVNGNNILMTEMNKSKKKLKFKLFSDYYFTQGEKKKLEKIKQRNHSNIDLEEVQNEIAVMSLDELKTHELSNTLSIIMQPHINLKNHTYKFYFTSYNQLLSEEELSKYIDDFKKMYLKGQECATCGIKKIKLKTFLGSKTY